MDNKNINITDLIRKYEQMRYINKKLYFDADEFAMLANHYNKKKNTSEAERVVNIGLGMHPHSSELMMVKAKVLVASKKYDIAYDYLLTIAEDESNVGLLLLKFECLLNSDRRREADAFLGYILKGELDNDAFYKFVKEVGYLYNDAERFETSIILLEKARKFDGANMDVLLELAYAYEWDDNIDKAIEITNTIIDLNPYSFDAWVSLGRLHSYNYEYEQSIEAYDFALAIKESDVSVLKLKALTYNQENNYEEEFKVLNECIDASPEDESLYDNLLEKYKEFEVYWGMDQDEEILKVLMKKEARFGSKGLLLKIAHHYLRLNKVEKAKDVFTRVAEEEKTTVEYYKIEGELALLNDDIVAAEAAFMLAYSLSPKDVEVLDNLAEINSDNDNNEKAAEYLEQLNAVDPEYGIVQFRLAIVRFEIGEKDPFNEIINQISDEEVLRMLLGLFAMQVNKERSNYIDLSREELLIRLYDVMDAKVQLNKK